MAWKEGLGGYLPGVKPRVLQKLPRRLAVLGPPRQHPPHKVEKHGLIPPCEDALGLLEAIPLGYRDVRDPRAYITVSPSLLINSVAK